MTDRRDGEAESLSVDLTDHGRRSGKSLIQQVGVFLTESGRQWQGVSLPELARPTAAARHESNGAFSPKDREGRGWLPDSDL
jgi:hypothetical protein